MVNIPARAVRVMGREGGVILEPCIVLLAFGTMKFSSRSPEPSPAPLARFHSPKRPDRGLTNVRIRIPQSLPERWQGRPGVMTDQSQGVHHFRAHLGVPIAQRCHERGEGPL